MTGYESDDAARRRAMRHAAWEASCREVEAHDETLRAAMPALLAGPLAGRHVVWNGAVVSDHETWEDAVGAMYRAGLLGHAVVARVEPELGVWLHDALKMLGGVAP